MSMSPGQGIVHVIGPELGSAFHDLGEALTLADRIILFSARPGQIKDMFEVDFARPRDAVKVRESRAMPSCSSTSGTRSARNSSRDATHEDTSHRQYAGLADLYLRRRIVDLAMGI